MERMRMPFRLSTCDCANRRRFSSAARRAADPPPSSSASANLASSASVVYFSILRLLSMKASRSHAGDVGLRPPSAPAARNDARRDSAAASCARTAPTSAPTSRARLVDVLRTFWHDAPNRREQLVSSAWRGSADTVTTSAVRQLPPRDCLSSIVSAESRNGTNLAPAPPLASAWMTRPSADRLVLMLRASVPATPALPLLSRRSLPARSTKRNLDSTRRLPRVCEMASLTTQCERELRALSACDLALRVASMRRLSLATSTADRIGTSFCPAASYSGVARQPLMYGGTHLPFASRSAPDRIANSRPDIPAFALLPMPAMGTSFLALHRSKHWLM
mmetsp:Transcript_16471/g.57623  ORF Transcript_16471/g.57623 Transcript_16471/m.57623 type:complete len:335 (-) Transcript_16471:80-1084(-)